MTKDQSIKQNLENNNKMLLNLSIQQNKVITLWTELLDITNGTEYDELLLSSAEFETVQNLFIKVIELYSQKLTKLWTDHKTKMEEVKDANKDK